MKTHLLSALTMALLVPGPNAFACGENMRKTETSVSLISSTRLKTFEQKVNVPINKKTFFCANDTFVLKIPDLKKYTQLNQPTVITQEVPCADYDSKYFKQLYKEIVKQGGMELYVYLDLNIELVTDDKGELTCQKVLSESVFPGMACMGGEQRIVLEKLPLSACTP